MKYGRKFFIVMAIAAGMIVVSLIAMLLKQAQPDALFVALGGLGATGVGASAYEDGKKSDNGVMNGAA